MAQFELNGVHLRVPGAFLTKRIRMKLNGGGYEGNEARATQLVVQQGDRVLDLGAGLGYIATLSALRAGAENVVTVEANPELLPVIRANLDANGCAATTLLHGAAVGAAAPGETLRLRQAPAFWASALTDEDEGIDVPALAVSYLIAQHQPTVVMMDVEGAEAGMFDAQWPDHVRAVTLELHPARYADTVIKRIFDCMSASGLIYAPDLSRGAMVGFCREGMPLGASA